MAVAAAGAACDVRVLVIAEAAKAEDLAAVRSASAPVLIVLTKADLAGSGSGGPLAVAHAGGPPPSAP